MNYDLFIFRFGLSGASWRRAVAIQKLEGKVSVSLRICGGRRCTLGAHPRSISSETQNDGLRTTFLCLLAAEGQESLFNPRCPVGVSSHSHIDVARYSAPVHGLARPTTAYFDSDFLSEIYRRFSSIRGRAKNPRSATAETSVTPGGPAAPHARPIRRDSVTRVLRPDE
ncbi:hypothetical protein EVAR_60213_1 [Eumeta japonica]|uniref:Uncharacterized protein n=1 Tax=Eumeta variegata TaxID=151549 RepID=A0A4C1ZBF5_EUMVA|nr:hypothetical protein EVAR_60213_1 [Eumeta japonica]